MAKKTASVAYEDPRHDKKEAAYVGKVRRALDDMGAPNSGELVHNSAAYVTGVYRAGVEPLDAAAVLWHQHCGKSGQATTPCVAECPMEETAAACPPAPVKPAVAVVAVAEEHPLLPRITIHILKHAPNDFEVIAKIQRHYGGHWDELHTSTAHSATDARGLARSMKAVFTEDGKAKSIEIVHGASEMSEARDSAPSAAEVPVAKIVRDEAALAASKATSPEPIESDRDAYLLLREKMKSEAQEVFVVLCIDLNRQLQYYVEVARGQRDRVVLDVTDVMRTVVTSNCHGFIVAHNHPSGEAKPSDADRELTERIRAAASPFSAVFVDHIVVGDGQWYSFTDEKLKKL